MITLTGALTSAAKAMDTDRLVVMLRDSQGVEHTVLGDGDLSRSLWAATFNDRRRPAHTTPVSTLSVREDAATRWLVSFSVAWVPR